MVGAVEFLRKAKEICNEHQDVDGFKLCEICPAKLLCESNLNYVNESDIVAKVMTYHLPTDEFDGKKAYEEAMKQDFNICDVCEDNQITDCVYLENDDRKSCPKVMAYKIKESNDAERN